MKLTKDQFQKINGTHKWIADWCPYLDEHDYIEYYLDDEIAEFIKEKKNIENITFTLPPEDSQITIEIKEYLALCDEIPTIEVVNSGFIKTKLRRYYIVDASTSDEDYSYIIKNRFDFRISPRKGMQIDLLEESLIVGLAATHLEEYSDYWGTVSQYTVVEIVYENEESILPMEDEKSLLNAYFFEIADSTSMALAFSQIWDPTPHFETKQEEFENIAPSGLRDLDPENEGMNLFVSAVQTNDPELKFLGFYKVLEHFAPVAINIEANELMRKKLDAPKGSFENGDYIRSIFKLANSMKAKSNDQDLIKACFHSCFDFIFLFEKLPKALCLKIKKHLKIVELDHSLDKQKITTAINMASKAIYETRNAVVHAKSNYEKRGDEISLKEFHLLNEFMKEASSQAIRWYSRQPSHLRMSIIE